MDIQEKKLVDAFVRRRLEDESDAPIYDAKVLLQKLVDYVTFEQFCNEVQRIRQDLANAWTAVDYKSIGTLIACQREAEEAYELLCLHRNLTKMPATDLVAVYTDIMGVEPPGVKPPVDKEKVLC